MWLSMYGLRTCQQIASHIRRLITSNIATPHGAEQINPLGERQGDLQQKKTWQLCEKKPYFLWFEVWYLFEEVAGWMLTLLLAAAGTGLEDVLGKVRLDSEVRLHRLEN